MLNPSIANNLYLIIVCSVPPSVDVGGVSEEREFGEGDFEGHVAAAGRLPLLDSARPVELRQGQCLACAARSVRGLCREDAATVTGQLTICLFESSLSLFLKNQIRKSFSLFKF